MKIKTTLLVSALASTLMMTTANAQSADAKASFPSEPIRVTIPYAPGGGTDFLSRTVVNKMSEQTGWPMVVENRPGAAGTIAMNHALRAGTDGHNIILGQLDTVAIAPAIYTNVTWDPEADFEPIGLMAISPLLLVSHADGPYKNLGDAIKAAKDNPGKIDYASPGVGSISHLSVALLEQEAGIDLQHIPYKGAGPAMNDLLGQRVGLYVASIAAAMPQIQAGKVQPLGVTTGERSPALPDTPTIAESGYPGVEIDLWYGLFAPKGVDADKMKILRDALNNALKDPEVVKLLSDQGLTSSPGEPQVLADLVKRDVARWPAIVKKAGVTSN
ncbi:Bug family tripartite tricarboxylate transporter substrate binding protein [Orrella sp. 11846]|uniref:Bug family tripartite tricarboxylate transporter substrate binding protein n=1 Tax=Orrella sp. 11846 TaxID=3409913 RepID=UPI003B5B6BB8